MSLATKYSTELLAPAGSLEAFFGAIEAGADAIYCGLKEFSARSKAKNFTIQEMENLCAYAHKLDKKLYIPLNTLIQEAEQPRLLDVLEGIVQCQIDGLIIQDLGVYNLIHQFFPEIPLHASTQMAVHNSAGVQMLEKMGFERAVLARELSLPEIKEIRENTTIELEHFIHGALCYSISGQCLFSSFQTGNSGNRGGCAQPCRRQYTQNNISKFTFSTSDFNALAHIPKLAKNGIMSFKIEGRMKNSEYVWNVVRAYRKVLDCQEDDIPQAILHGTEILKQAHGRQATSGFLTAKRSTILLPDQKGGIGTTCGKIDHASGKYISFTTKTELHIGDRIRIQPKSDKPGSSFTIREIEAQHKRIRQAKNNQTITIQTPFRGRFSSGDHIFKISTGRGFNLSEEACRRRLKTTKINPTDIQLTIACSTTTLVVEITQPIYIKHTYNIETYPAQKSPLSTKTLHNIFRKTGHPEIKLGSLKALELAPVVIKPSHLKAIRRKFYDEICKELQAQRKKTTAKRQEKIKTTANKTATLTNSFEPKLFVQSEYAHEDLTHAPNIHLILPVDTALPYSNDQEYQHIWWNIPTIIYDTQWQKIGQQIREKITQGYTKFRLNNMSHFNFFTQTKNLQLMAGPSLYCLNHNAMEALKYLHIEYITMSFEDDKTNTTSLKKQPYTTIQPIYGRIPLMTSRIPLKSQETINTAQGSWLTPQVTESGLTTIHANNPFSLSGRLHELQSLNSYNYLIDLRYHSAAKRQNILSTIQQDKHIPNSTTFNFDRGLK